MSENEKATMSEPARKWMRETFDTAIRELIAGGLIEVEVIEARPTWALEGQAVIGQIREANASSLFRWVICGDVPTDHIGSEVAATPRDAAKHFSMKWQIDAERQSATSEAGRLVTKAEQLFELTEMDELWD